MAAPVREAMGAVAVDADGGGDEEKDCGWRGRSCIFFVVVAFRGPLEDHTRIFIRWLPSPFCGLCSSPVLDREWVATGDNLEIGRAHV